MYCLEVLREKFVVCKLPMDAVVDLNRPFTFVARTDGELSLVCPAEAVPDGVLERQESWRCIRLAGTLDFSLVGILAALAGVLARAEISIFAVSTFDTDYVLMPAERLEDALAALAAAGYGVARL